MSKTALITGAAGFVGSHLVDRLLADGWSVTGVDSFESYYRREYKEANLVRALEHPRFVLHEENLLDLGAPGGRDSIIFDCVAAADAVFHLAAQAGVRSSWGNSFQIYTDNNILATQMLLEACRGAGVERFVYASSSSVYGNTPDLPMHEDARCVPFSPYGVSKLAAENLCALYHANFGVPAVALRFFTVYGPRQRPDMGFHRFIRAVMEGRAVTVFGDGHQTRDFTYVSDIVDGLIASLDASPGGVFNLAGGSRVSVWDVLQTLDEVMDEPVTTNVVEEQAGDVRDTLASTERARDQLGYSPKVMLADGLAREVEWLRLLTAEPGYPWDGRTG